MSALGRVIQSRLNKADHIPFRESKLTTFLSDCFNQNCKVLLFVNINTIKDNKNETISSLNFANGCRDVKLRDESDKTPKMKGQTIGKTSSSQSL